MSRADRHLWQLSPAMRIAATAVVCRLDPATFRVFVGRDVAREVGLSPGRVYEAVAWLRRHGVITASQRRSYCARLLVPEARGWFA